MARNIAISFSLTAALSGGFRNAFQGASNAARNVAGAIRQMERSPTGQIGAAMARQRESIRGLATNMREAQATLSGLQARAQAAGGASGMLARQIQQAEARVNNLNGALQRQLATWRQTTAQAATQGGSVRRLSQEYDQLAQRVEHARRAQANMAANRASLDTLRGERAGLMAQMAATAGAAMTMAMPAKIAIGFEQSIANVGAVANASDEDLKRLTETARQLGRDTQYSASEAAEGMKYLAMAGFDTEKMIAAMPGMLNLAAASNTDLARTADIASNILTAFGMRADEMGVAADVLAKAASTSNTDLSMLGDTMKYVGPVAHSLGMSLQDTAAMAGLMANAGIQASQGGTALRAAMLRLAAPPKMAADQLRALAGVGEDEVGHLMEMIEEDGGDAEGALKKIGMSTKDAAGNMRPLADILEELNVKTAEMGSGERTGVFKAVFGTEASAAMIALADQAATTVDEYGNQIVDSLGRPTTAMRKYLETVNDSLGTSEQIAKKRMATTHGSLLLLSSAWQDVGISVGNMFMPAIQSAAGVLSTVANAISAFTERFPRLSKGLALAAAGVIAFVGAVTLIGMLTNIVRTFTAVVQGFGVVSRIAGIGARIFAGGIRSIMAASGIGLLIVAIGLLIEHWDTVVDVMKGAWNWIKRIWGNICNFFIGVWDSVSKYVTAVWTAFKAGLTVLWNGVVAIFTWAKNRAIAIWQGITGFFSGLWNGIKSVTSSIWNGICAVFGWVRDKAIAIWEGYTSMLAAQWNWIKSTAQSIWNGVVAVFTWAKDMVVAAWNGITGFFAAIWDGICSACAWASDTVVAIWNGVTGFFQGIADWIGGIFGGAWDGVCSACAWARDTVVGIWNGVVGFFQGIVDWIGGIFGGVWDGITGSCQWAVDGICAIWDGVVGFFQGIVDWITGLFSGFFDWIKEKFAWIFDTIDAIGGAISSVTGAIGSAWNWLTGGGDEDKGSAAKAAESAQKEPAAKAAAEASAPKRPAGRSPSMDAALSFDNAEASAPNAQAAQGQKKRNAVLGPDWKPGAPVQQDAPKAGGKKKAGGRARSGGGGRARSGGGGGASSGASAGAASRDSGPVTIVKLDGGNQIKTQFFAAGSANAAGNAAANAAAAGKSTVAASTAQAARSIASGKTVGLGIEQAALPRSPELVAQKQPKAKAAQQNQGEITIDLTQNFDLITQDASTARKILETLKPEFEALIRAALAKISSNRTRTAYAQ